MAPIRLACRIEHEASIELSRLIARRKSRKGKTLVHLMERAREQPDFPQKAFHKNGSEESCTLNVSQEWLDTFDDYRARHGLYENTSFCKDAVLRGLSIELSTA